MHRVEEGRNTAFECPVALTSLSGGVANTSFWIDPSNELTALIFTQVIGSHPDFSIQTDFRNRVYMALGDAIVDP